LPDDIFIPESARAIKANYAERPSDALVAEIKKFIKETGTPYLWHGHTHTKPQAGAIIMYRGEFDLPPSHAGRKNKRNWSPCPCCKHKSLWFFKNGKIAWFPEEKVIRMIGGDCFKAINAAGHEEAEGLFRQEEARRKTEAYLTSHLALVPKILDAIAHNTSIIEDIDRVRFIFSKRLGKAIDFDLWHHVRTDGALKVEVTRTEQRVGLDGNHTEVTVQDFQRYGPLAGHEMLKPDVKPIAERIEALTVKLRMIDFGENYLTRLASMGDDNRSKAVKALRAASSIQELITEAEDIRRFLSPLSLGSLNGWSKTDGSPAKIYIALSDDRAELSLGKDQDSARAMIFKPIFFNALRAIPPIGKSINDLD
jgi:hypothetical protein